MACAQPLPQIHDIGVLSNSVTSRATGVSADGGVVIGSSTVGTGDHAVKWTPAGGLVDLDACCGSSVSQALGVSANGSTIVGFSTDTGEMYGHLFTWTSAGGMRDQTPPAGALGNWGLACSADGSTVIGHWYAQGQFRAFRRVGAGAYTELVAPAGVINAYAQACSADGSVVAGRMAFADRDRAFRWTAVTGMVDLGALPGDSYSEITAATPDGLTLVGRSIGPGGVRAFRWSPMLGMQNLGALANGVRASVSGLTASGNAVVGSCEVYGITRATLWTPSRGMVDLNVLLPALGVDLSEWHLSVARGVSADGTTMVGEGMFRGRARGWVVTGLPAPGCVQVIVPPMDQRVCPGEAATLWTLASDGGTDPLTYAWQRWNPDTGLWQALLHGALPRGTLVSGETGPVLSLSNLAPGDLDAQGYMTVRCRVGNSCGFSYTDPARASMKSADLNLDGNADQDDVIYLIAIIGGEANPSGADPDLSGDGNADQDDVVALVNWLSGGGCP